MSDFARLESLFFAALAKAEPEERQRYLDAECGQDAALREQVERLLAGQVAAGSFLQKPAAPEATQAYAVANEKEPELLGSQVGPYKLLQKLGEGGMGTVWVAEQEKPVKRRVALKLIKAGMDSAQVIRRFEAERQALALMDHTNIAKVLDAGTSANGRPYFVMELVKGVPITKYCDEVHASINNRLELYVQVCSAVQHAHQKGIIHRDIKPSNILIAMQDGKPVPKVIDFGVAKALHSKLADKTMYTEIGQIIGTLEYMAPEQAELSAMDIDTRADIYALGVLLYELLTGSTPITRERMKSAAFAEVLRLIKEEDPPKPSTRLTQSKESIANLAALRKTDPKHLSFALKGELDWVVLKALEKDRTCRYETANGLARDIQRYLADEVVEARPPSVGYRLKKFVRRNRGKVLAAGLVAMVLVLGVVGTTWGLIEAKKQERIAVAAADEERKAKDREAERAEGEKQAKLSAEAKRVEAERNLAFAKKGNDLLGSVFAGLDPKANYATVGELSRKLKDNLVKAVKELDGSAIGDPLVVAGMQNTLGCSLLGLGDASQAVVLFEKALVTRTASLGHGHPDTLKSMRSLAEGYVAAGKLGKALPLAEETLKLTKAKLGPDHPDTLHSMNTLAQCYQDAGQWDKALPLLEEELKLAKANLGPDHRDTLSIMNNLASGYHNAGKLHLALPLFEESLKRMKANFGLDHPDTLLGMNNLASTYQKVAQLDKALPLYEETLRLRKAKLGPDHPDTHQSMHNLARGYQDAGQLDKALPLSEEALKLAKAKLGPEHPSTLTSMNALATGYQAAGQWDKALPLYEETLRLRTAKLGPDHPSTLISMVSLATVYLRLGQLDKALPLAEETLKLSKAKLGPDHPFTFFSMASLARGYQAAGQSDKALPLYEEASRGMEKLGFRHVYARSILPPTIAAYEGAKQFEKADEWRAKWLGFVKKESGVESATYAGELAMWGTALHTRQRWVEAEAKLRECLAIREKKEPDSWNTFNTHSVLGGALLGQKKYADAEPLLLKGYEGIKQREKTIPPQAGTRIPEALDRLIQLYTETNKPDEVKKWQAEKDKLPKPVEKK